METPLISTADGLLDAVTHGLLLGGAAQGDQGLVLCLGPRRQEIVLLNCGGWLRMRSDIVPWDNLLRCAPARRSDEAWRLLLEANRGLTGVGLHREDEVVFALVDVLLPATCREAMDMAHRLARVADGWQLRWGR